jgi:hypothetical protein
MNKSETKINENKRTICWSFNCFATSRGPDPDISIQVLEKRAQAESINVIYTAVWMGSRMASLIVWGGDM